MHAPETSALPAQSFFKGVWDYLCSDTGGAAVALALLVASLIAFLVSTRQWPLRQRAFVWLAGAGLLLGSVFIGGDVVGGGHFFSSLSEVLGDSVARSVIANNFHYVAGYAEPLLNTLFVLCWVFAVVALIAFTPGEFIERNLRRAALIIGGAVLGTLLTLGLAIVGLGGNAKRAVYIAKLTDADVIDGDTIRMGDVSVRIAGINAHELECEGDDCGGPGVAARQFLRNQTRGQVVVCIRPRGSDKGKPLESFGRPVVECFLAGVGIDKGNLGPNLIDKGLARACRKNKDDANKEYWTAVIGKMRNPELPSLPPCPNNYWDANGQKWK